MLRGGGSGGGVSQLKPALCAIGRYRGVSQLYCRKSRLDGPLSTPLSSQCHDCLSALLLHVQEHNHPGTRLASPSHGHLSSEPKMCHNRLGPAKTYTLRGTLQTHAIKTRVDNLTIKKDPPKGNRRPVRGTNGPVRGTEDPVTGTGPLLIARNPF